MGWGDCGNDSQGRPIGYYFEAICDEPGCNISIDRGLSYVCGQMHGEGTYSCEKYFCSKHRGPVYVLDNDGNEIQLCDGEWVCKSCENAAIEDYKEYGC